MSKTDNDAMDPPQTQKKAGYGNPPMKRRFKDCGNAKGRPKRSKNRKTIVKEIANEMHALSENGKPKQRSTLALILLQLRNLVMAGKNPRAFDEWHRFVKIFQPEATREDVGYLVVPAPVSPLEWIRRQEDNNRFSISPAERTARVDKILENNPDMSQLEAGQLLDNERAAEKERILQAEKLQRADEILKTDPTIDHDEAVRRAEAERHALLYGEKDSPDGKLP